MAERNDRERSHPADDALASDWQVRRAAISELGDEEKRRAVISAMAHLRGNPRDLALGSAAGSLLRLPLDGVLPALVDCLSAADPDLRTQAAQLLGQQRHPGSVAPLIAALQDPDDNVRFHAIEALGTLGSPEAVEPLLGVAARGSWFLASGALQAIADIGAVLEPSRLRSHLLDRSLQEVTLDALVATAPEAALEGVVTDAVALLDSGVPPASVARSLRHVHDRLDAWHGGGDACLMLWLGRTVNDTRLERLVDAAATSAGGDADDLARVLTWLTGPTVATALARLLPIVSDPEVVLEGLLRDKKDAALPLVAALGEDTPVAAEVIGALGKLGDPSATGPLLDHLAAHPERAIVIAGALGRLRDARALGPLVGLLAAEDAAVRHAAVGAISAIGAPETESRLQALLGDSRPHVREGAIRIAGYFGFDSCAPTLLQACADSEPSVRHAALECVGMVDDPEVGQQLTAALAAGDNATRIAAVRGLAAWDDEAATPLLRIALTDDDPWVRYAAARALAACRDESTRALLIERAASDSAPPVRIAAIESAGAPRSDAERAVMAGIAAGDPVPEVRQIARAVLDPGRDPSRR
jgi:HEAT repeat protein